MPETAPQHVLYLGDTALTAAAAYLAGVMHRAGIAFDYCPSGEKIGDALRASERRLIILSDYPASQLREAQHDEIVAANGSGTGVLMLGGWESYHGMGGDWHTSPVADLLPVSISPSDDRINHDQAALLRQVENHPTADGLPWDDCPPCVGGYNRFTAKPDATTVLEVVRQSVHRMGDAFGVRETTIDPMLVVSPEVKGQGRVACLATDAAPHWVGPFVDWGTSNTPAPSGKGRVPCQAPGASEVEVGQHYAQFFTQLVRWTASLEDK